MDTYHDPGLEIPRELYKYLSAADVNGELTVVNEGDDEGSLQQTLKIPDDDDFRQAAHHFMIPGVWRTDESYFRLIHCFNKLMMLVT